MDNKKNISKSFKALGGLIEVEYLREDLPELSGSKGEEILDDIKEFLENKEKGKDQKEKAEKKHPEDKNILSNDDIPYEVRMKYIIKAYRKDQEKWGKLVEYAKHLEAEVIRLKNILISNGYTDSGVVEDSEPAKVIKGLKAEIEQLKKDLKECKKTATNKKVERMKSLIEEEYPLRKLKVRTLKLTVKNMQAYIEELQGLLDENAIIYGPMELSDKEVVDNIDNYDETAIRLMADLENI